MIPDRLSLLGRPTMLEGLINNKRHRQWKQDMPPPNPFNSRSRLADRNLNELRQMMPFSRRAPQLVDQSQHRTMESKHQPTNDKALLNHHRLLRMIHQLMKNSTDLLPNLLDSSKLHSNTLLAPIQLAHNQYYKCNHKHRLNRQWLPSPSQRLHQQVLRVRVGELD